ncbi:MAG: hypothetical protein RJA25_2303 [Bacteroidota bacterium]
MQKLTLYILLSLFSLLGYSQYELKGIVIDAKTKEPLPYVNYSVGIGLGGTTDDSGRFEITANSKTDSIVFSYLGYKDESFKKRFFRKDSIIIKMHLESFMLEEFTIKAKRRKIPKDTAAIRIYRNVLKHKAENRPKSFDSYQYEEYAKTVASLYNVSAKITKRKIFKPFRFILENQDSTAEGSRFIPLILKETISDHYINKEPKKNKTVVKASKISGIEQLRFSELLDIVFDDIDIYDNQAMVHEKAFVMPFAEGAIALYNYYVIDSTKGADSVWTYNLAFVPKSKSDLLFNGKATIRDSSYAITKIDLGIDRRSNVNFINDFSLKQSFTNTGKGWFKNEESRSSDIAFTKRKRAKSIRIARYIHRNDIIVDEPIADSILSQENTVFIKNYRKKTDSFWVANRHDTLSVPESKVYFLLDSLKRTRFYKAVSGVGSFFATGYYKTKVIDIGNLYQMVTWNDLEGVRLRLNLKNNWRIGKWVEWRAYVAYGIKDKRVKYGAKMTVNLPDKKNKKHQLVFSYNDDYQRFTLQGNVRSYDFIYLSILRNKAIADLVYLKDARFSYYREWVPNFSTNLSLEYKIYQTIPGRIEFKKTMPDSTVVTYNNFKVFSPNINFTYTPGAKFLQMSEKKQFLKGKLPRINFTYTFSNKKFGSDFNFQKLDLLIEERLPSPIGHTLIRLSGTKLFGSAPYPLLSIHPGNQSFMYSEERFTNMLETEFIADQQLSLMFEHHFDGFIFNKIPGWKKLGLREVFTTKMAVSSLSPSRVSFSDLPPQLKGLNGFYAEVGFGIENILKLIRMDFSWRLTQLNQPNIKKFRWAISFSPGF